MFHVTNLYTRECAALPVWSRTSAKTMPPMSRCLSTHPHSVTMRPSSPSRRSPQVWSRAGHVSSLERSAVLTSFLPVDGAASEEAAEPSVATALVVAKLRREPPPRVAPRPAAAEEEATTRVAMEGAAISADAMVLVVPRLWEAAWKIIFEDATRVRAAGAAEEERAARVDAKLDNSVLARRIYVQHTGRGLGSAGERPHRREGKQHRNPYLQNLLSFWQRYF
jgi:hypothetical protein